MGDAGFNGDFLVVVEIGGEVVSLKFPGFIGGEFEDGGEAGDEAVGGEKGVGGGAAIGEAGGEFFDPGGVVGESGGPAVGGVGLVGGGEAEG